MRKTVFELIREHKAAVQETPCIVVDTETAKKNICRMQEAVSACGCKLRPHIKTHKIPYFARLQLAAGAEGITCAKVSEAEVMAAGGVEDIFIAYPMVGEFRIHRALELQKRVKRLILAVDSLEGAAALSRSAGEAGLTCEVRLEVDTGARRTGVTRGHVLELAGQIAALPHLNLTGIYTFKSLVLHGCPTEDNKAAAVEEAELMSGMAASLRTRGLPTREVSAGFHPYRPSSGQDRSGYRGTPRYLYLWGLDAHKRELCSSGGYCRPPVCNGGEHSRAGLCGARRRYEDLSHGYSSGHAALPVSRICHSHRRGRQTR